MPGCNQIGQECCCKECCCGLAPAVKPCYKQPRIPDSYAPRRCYMKPSAPVECTTTYNMSYIPNKGCAPLREPMTKPTGNFVPSTAPMEGSTVHKLSFLPNPVCQVQPLRPCNHNMFGKGQMQSITTQKHDYVPKPNVMRESFKPIASVHTTDEPFEDRTTSRLSYITPERMPRLKSYAPERLYERPNAKMDCHTTQNTSYLPNKIMKREPIPWANKGHYIKPCQKLDGNSVYAMSYLENTSDCRRMPIVPETRGNPVTVEKTFDGQTVYKQSFIPSKASPSQPIKYPDNIVPSNAAVEGNTVHKLSFLPNPVCVTQPIRPCHHDMWGQGPMQNITTQRHDYVPKPSVVRESFKPVPQTQPVQEPFENRTINRMSYINPGRQPLPNSFAPINQYERPVAKMDCETVHKMSFQPVCTPFPQKPPWTCKGQYQKPCQRLETTTVYRSSFLPPGEDCSQIMDPCTYGDCKPCTCICPSECITTNPCACAYPKAACCT